MPAFSHPSPLVGRQLTHNNIKCPNSRPARARATPVGGGDPAVLPEHVAGVHPEPAQCVAALRRHLRQDPRRADRAAHAGHAELQHVHLAEAEEPQAAAVPRGDLGRGGRVHDAGAARRAARAALAPRRKRLATPERREREETG